MNAPTIAVRERPILFSGEMMRAILDGRKTQTRRVVKPQPTGEPGSLQDWARGLAPYTNNPTPTPSQIAAKTDQLRGRIFPFRNERGSLTSPACPFGKPSDRLWVRETWSAPDACECPETCHVPSHVYYDADQSGYENARFNRRRASIHMPRWASRITLEVTEVRVERLASISREDAMAEGIDEYGHDLKTERERDERRNRTAIENYRVLWDSLNTKRGYGWDVNPWVWAITFKRVTP